MCFSNKCFGCPEKFRIYAIDAGASHDEWWIWHLNLDIWIGTSFMQLIQLGFQSIHRFLLWLMHWLHSPCLHLLWLHVLCRFLLWVPFVNATCSGLKVILSVLRSFCICGVSACTALVRTDFGKPAFPALDSGTDFCKPGLWHLLFRRGFLILQGTGILLGRGILCTIRGLCTLGRGIRLGTCVLRVLSALLGCRMLGTILGSYIFCPVLVLLFFSRCWFSCLFALLCSLRFLRCRLTH
mmetsp:Transcript_56397/g.100056  ORF Transcript_56397/g.100056 Transcript_56397/m.100056 type:complete len:239 (+) Transcript_56397:144-860(+)